MKTIKKGEKSQEAKILQELLIYHGFNITADGDFGSGTEKAVIAFQKDHFDYKGRPLDADGAVGALTWRSLLESEKEVQVQPVTKPNADNVTLKRIDKMHPKLLNELKEIYHEILERGVSVRFTHTLRTFKEQDALYAKGRNGNTESKVTNARGGQSYHNYGLAVDIVLLTPGRNVSWSETLDQDNDGQTDWSEIVGVFKHYGWTWGGDWTRFRDAPHFEKTFGYSTRELLAKHKNGDVDANGYVNL